MNPNERIRSNVIWPLAVKANTTSRHIPLSRERRARDGLGRDSLSGCFVLDFMSIAAQAGGWRCFSVRAALVSRKGSFWGYLLVSRRSASRLRAPKILAANVTMFAGQTRSEE